MIKPGQIFQTDDSKRWKSFKWSFRIILVVVVFFLVVLSIAILRGNAPSLPNLESKGKAYQAKLDPSNPLTLTENFNTKYKGFKKFLGSRIKEDSIKNLQTRKNSTHLSIPAIRAAFYTPWTANTSLPDLQKYGDKLNVIFPEWFFIDIATQKLQTRIDSAGLAVMRQKGLKILPMLTNFNSSKNDFDGKLLHGILNDKNKQEAFIKQLTDTLTHYHFQGINIDFEELEEPTNTPLTNFQQKIYERFHSLGLLVTMDVAVKNDDYDYEKLSANNDYIILMAYDQHDISGSPGPISDQKWIEESLDWTAARIDPKKIILGIGGFGYDWKIGRAHV